MAGPILFDKLKLMEDPGELLRLAITQCLTAGVTFGEITKILQNVSLKFNAALKSDPGNKEISGAMTTLANIYLKLNTAKTVESFQGTLRSSYADYLPKEEKEETGFYTKNWNIVKTNFNSVNSSVAPFFPSYKYGTVVLPWLNSAYFPGKTTYQLSDRGFVPDYAIKPSLFNINDEFGKFPRPFPPSSGEGPDQIRFTGLFRSINNAPLTMDGKQLSVENPTQVVNQPEAWFDAEASFKKLTDWVDVNYLNWKHHSAEKMQPNNYGKLDLLFRDDEKITGETMVLVDERKSGTVYGWYNDGKGNWFKTGAIMQDGKFVPGSGFEGELDMESLKMSASYMKNGEDDVFYAVVQLPKAGTTGFVQQTSDGKSDAAIVKHISGDWSAHAGYFRLKSGSFFGTKSVSDVEGGSVGVIKGKKSGKVYLGTEEGNINVIGIEGRIEGKTYFSYFSRRDKGGMVTNSNIEASHIQKLGEKTELRTSFRQILDGSGNDRGSGTIELKSGDTRIAFAYDNITNSDYWDVIDDYLKNAQNVRDTRQLLEATRQYLNANVLTNARYPLAQFEFEQKEFGKLTFSALKENGGQVSYTKPGGETTYAVSLSEVSKNATLKDIGFTFVYNPKKDVGIKNAFFQIDKERFSAGVTIEKFSIDVSQSLLGMGTRLKGLYKPDEGLWGYGAVIGTQPVSFSNKNPKLKENTNVLFFGALVEKNGKFLFENDQVSLDALVYPEPGIYSLGVNYNSDFGLKKLVFGAGANWLMVNGGAPSIQASVTFGYRLGK